MTHDAIVIGTGQGGSPLAETMASQGMKVALIERGAIGGTCINVGCTPTKTMVASARAAWLARRTAEYGVQASSVRVDLAKVRSRKQGVVDRFRNGKQVRLESTANLEMIFGEASFEGPGTVAVALRDGGTARLQSERIVLNTGCRPAVPRIEGLDQVPYLDSTSIMELDQIPRRLLIVGGGYIGLEFGQMFRRFGSAVVVVHRDAQLLTREDADVAQEVAKILTEEGIELILEAEPVRVRVRGRENGAAPGEQSLELTLDTSGGERVREGSHLLIATGRAPNTEALALGKAGVAVDERGYVVVNERLETSVPGVYAIGDVKGGPQFTHISYDDFRILRTNLLEGGAATTQDRFVPYTVFIDPQLGRVGITELEAKARGRRIRVHTMPMSTVARAIETGDTRGLLKAVVDADSDRILGFAALGLEGGELMSIVQVAMMGGLTSASLREATFAHPVLAESLNNLFRP